MVYQSHKYNREGTPFSPGLEEGNPSGVGQGVTLRRDLGLVELHYYGMEIGYPPGRDLGPVELLWMVWRWVGYPPSPHC